MTHDEGRWYEAARGNDPGFDGRFFAGVVTTGVYCRSVCPVPRPPKRENVRFYSSAAGAERAGFRPCRTCHPERSAGTPPWSGLPPVVSRALVLIAQGALDEGGVDELAARLGLGSRHLRRLFDEYLGASPVAIAKARRTHFARRLIDETDLPMTEIAFASGFRTLRQFNHDLRRTFGRSPTELRRRRPRAQARAIGALASAVAGGELALEASPDLDEFVARICELPGIGPWTAQYLAMRALGEPDAFPAGDLGLRRAVANGQVVSQRELERIAEGWRPWRAYAAMYLWTAGANGAGKATKAARKKNGTKKTRVTTATKESR